jgi:hypothetical protein
LPIKNKNITLEVAKKAVEIAIEEGEEKAMEYIRGSGLSTFTT